jgi:nucleoside-diphosphate-sugar epimerase
MRIALTGATGFLGSALLDRLIAGEHWVKALTRRPQPVRLGAEWIAGDLFDAKALEAMVAGMDAVIHVAGAVNAPDREGFAAANVTGTQTLITAARNAGVTRFIFVSSLSARAPHLSDYGWSKHAGEEVVRASGLDWTIVRPPAIYGPDDRQMLEMFRMARRGLVLLPPPGRLSIIHVEDLAELLVALAVEWPGGSRHELYEVDDGRPGGWAHRELVRAMGDAVGKHCLSLALPRAALMGVARLDRLARGGAAKLTPDRARYFSHPDWVADPERAVPAALWSPRIATPQGLAGTAQAYRAKGWLR